MYEYPFGNGQQLNLDWFLAEWKNLLAAWEAEKNGIEGALQAEIDRAEAALADVFAARDAAAQSAANALESKNAAAQSASDASGYLSTVQQNATAAQDAARNAAQSESDAADSAQTAVASKNAAGQSERNAAQSEANANSSKNAAAQSASDADASKSAAAQSAADADASKSAAAQSAEDASDAAASVETSAQQIATNTNDISDLKTTLTDIHVIEKSKNIYDASIPYVTGWLRDTGLVDATGSGASFGTTDFIPIEQNTDYIVANERVDNPGYVIGSRIEICLYDATKTYIANTFQNVIGATPMRVTFNSGNAYYLRVTTLPKHLGEHPELNGLIVQKGSTLDGYSTYWQRNVSLLYPSEISAKDNILFGKKYVACGDSLTAGDFTGYVDADGYSNTQSDAFSLEYGCYKTYPYWIASRNGMKLVNEAINGSIIALSKTYVDDNTTPINNRSPFSYQRYKNIPIDADYITIWFGVNDSSNTYLGTINDETNETFYGAWNVVLPYLVEHHPKAKIGIVITFGIPDSNYTVAVREVAKKWGIPYYDFARGEQSPIIIRNKDTGYAVDSDMVDLRLSQFRVTANNNHPNLAAHEFESYCLEAWLRSL